MMMSPVTLGKGHRLQGGWEDSVVRGAGSCGVKPTSALCPPGCWLEGMGMQG